MERTIATNLLALFAIVAGWKSIAAMVELPPEFANNKSDDGSYLLRSDEIWRPGPTTKVALLAPGRPLTMQVNAHSVAKSLGDAKHYLLYKCFLGDAEHKEIFLDSTADWANTTRTAAHGNQKSSIYCRHKQPFTVERVSGHQLNVYKLTLLSIAENRSRNGSSSYEELALKNSPEFLLKVNYTHSSGHLRSSNLIVHNWDGLPNLDTAQQSIKGVSYTRYILTLEAIKFLLDLQRTSGAALTKVPFLDTRFVQLIKTSSLLVRNYLAVTVIMKFKSTSCSEDPSPLSDLVVSTGEPLIFDKDLSSFIYSSLDLSTGELLASDNSLRNRTHSFHSEHAHLNRLCTVCLRIAVNSKVWRYNITKTVMQFPFTIIRAASNNIKSIGTGCMVQGNLSHSDLQLIAGMSDVVLRSPIVCNMSAMDDVIPVVYFNSGSCQLSGSSWKESLYECGHFSINRAGTAVSLRGRLSQVVHSGNYTFSQRGVIFQYRLTLLALPLFVSENNSGTLTPAISTSQYHVQLFDASCRTFYSNLHPSFVILRPLFRVLSSGTRVLQELTADDFAIEKLKRSPRDLRQTVVRGPYNSSLRIRAPNRQVGVSAMSFLLICRVSLISSEAARVLGTSSYSSETHSHIFYRRIRFSRSRWRAGAASSLSPSNWLILAGPLGIAVTLRSARDFIYASN